MPGCMPRVLSTGRRHRAHRSSSARTLALSCRLRCPFWVRGLGGRTVGAPGVPWPALCLPAVLYGAVSGAWGRPGLGVPMPLDRWAGGASGLGLDVVHPTVPEGCMWQGLCQYDTRGLYQVRHAGSYAGWSAYTAARRRSVYE